MAGWIMFVPGAAALAVAVLVSVIASRRVVGLAGPGRSAAIVATSRRIPRWRLTGLAVGLIAALLLANGPSDWLGLGLALAAPTAALCLLVGVIIGEVTESAPAGAVRTAAVEIRQTRSYLPRTMTWTVLGLTVVFAGLLITTSAVAAPDDVGRPG